MGGQALGRRWATAWGPTDEATQDPPCRAGVDAGGVGRQHAAEVTNRIGHAYLGRTDPRSVLGSA
jgi:hypothetical protein